MSLKPIFVGGVPRSGTTMLADLLGGAGPNCIVIPELPLKIRIFDRFESHHDMADASLTRRELEDHLATDERFSGWQLDVSSLPSPEVLRIADIRRFVEEMVTRYASKRNRLAIDTWIDHTPANIRNCLRLLTVFPDARFVHIVRDPRAVAASVFPLDWGPKTTRKLALSWSTTVLCGLAFERQFPDRCHSVRFEDLVLDPEPALRKICSFAGLAFSERMLEGGNFDLPAYTKGQHSLVGSPPDRSRIEAWKERLSPRDINEIQRHLGESMPLFGYPAVTVGALRGPSWKRAHAASLKLTRIWNRIRYKRRFAAR